MLDLKEEIKKIDAASSISELSDLEKLYAENLRLLVTTRSDEQNQQDLSKVLHLLGILYIRKAQLTNDPDNFISIECYTDAAKFFQYAISLNKQELNKIKDQAVDTDVVQLGITEAESRITEAHNQVHEINKRLVELVTGDQYVQAKHSVLQISDLDKLRLEELRKRSKLQLAEVDFYLEAAENTLPEEKSAREKICTERSRSLFEYITAEMKLFLADLYRDAQEILGEPPCNYSVVGLGSMALQQVTPYSDLEFAILTENEEYRQSTDPRIRNYFTYLTHLVHFRVINLGETIIPKSKYGINLESFIARGVNFDLGGKTPLGRIDKDKPYCLIQNIHEMIHYLKNENSGSEHRDKALPWILESTVHVWGDISLTTQYKNEAKVFLFPGDARVPRPHRERALYRLTKDSIDRDYLGISGPGRLTSHLEAYKPKFLDSGQTGTPFNVKQEMYRIVDRLCYDLALFCSETEVPQSVWNAVDNLQERLFGQDNELAKQIMVASNYIMLLRLRTYLYYGEQNEDMVVLSNNVGTMTAAAQTMFESEILDKSSKLFAYVRIIYTFYYAIREFVGLSGNFLFTRVTLLPVEKISAQLYFRCGFYQASIKEAQIALTYSPEDISIRSLLVGAYLNLMDFKSAKRILDEINFDHVEDLSYRTGLLFNRGVVYYNLAQSSGISKTQVGQRLNEALVCYKKVVEAVEGKNQDDILADTHDNIGLVHLELKQYVEARSDLLYAYELRSKLGVFKQAISLIHLGRLYYLQENFEEAVKYFEKAINLFPYHNFHRQFEECFRLGADSYAQMAWKVETAERARFFSLSDSFYDNDINLIRKYYGSGDILAHVLLDRAFEYFRREEHDKVSDLVREVDSFEQSFGQDVLRKIASIKGMMSNVPSVAKDSNVDEEDKDPVVLYNSALAAHQQNKFEQSIVVAEKALSLRLDVDQKSFLRCLIADSSARLHLWKKSFQTILELARVDIDSHLIGVINNFYILFESSYKECNGAIALDLARVVETCITKRLDFTNPDFHFSQGNQNLDKGNLEFAVDFYKLAIIFVEQDVSYDIRRRQGIYHNLGCVYTILAIRSAHNREDHSSVEYYNKAQETFQKAIGYSRETENNAGLYTEYANFLLGQQNFKEAFFYLKQAIASCDSESKLGYGVVEKSAIPPLLQRTIDAAENKSIEVIAIHYAYYLLISHYDKFKEAPVTNLESKATYIALFANMDQVDHSVSSIMLEDAKRSIINIDKIKANLIDSSNADVAIDDFTATREFSVADIEKAYAKISELRRDDYAYEIEDVEHIVNGLLSKKLLKHKIVQVTEESAKKAESEIIGLVKESIVSLFEQVASNDKYDQHKVSIAILIRTKVDQDRDQWSCLLVSNIHNQIKLLHYNPSGEVLSPVIAGTIRAFCSDKQMILSIIDFMVGEQTNSQESARLVLGRVSELLSIINRQEVTREDKLGSTIEQIKDHTDQELQALIIKAQSRERVEDRSTSSLYKLDHIEVYYADLIRGLVHESIFEEEKIGNRLDRLTKVFQDLAELYIEKARISHNPEYYTEAAKFYQYVISIGNNILLEAKKEATQTEGARTTQQQEVVTAEEIVKLKQYIEVATQQLDILRRSLVELVGGNLQQSRFQDTHQEMSADKLVLQELREHSKRTLKEIDDNLKELEKVVPAGVNLRNILSLQEDLEREQLEKEEKVDYLDLEEEHKKQQGIDVSKDIIFEEEQRRSWIEQREIDAYIDIFKGFIDVTSKRRDEIFVQGTRELFEHITNEMKSFLANLYKEAQAILGEPPCNYAVMGLGSMALQQITPYSDLEFAILTENEEYKQSTDQRISNYFTSLTHLVHLRVINLGETIIPESKYNIDLERFVRRGVNFDLGGKTPLGRKDKPYSLIQTPEKMTGYLEEKYWHVDKSLPSILEACINVYEYTTSDRTDVTQQSLVKAYKDKVSHFLHLDNHDGIPNFRARALRRLKDGNIEYDYSGLSKFSKAKGNLEVYAPQLIGQENEGRLFDIKQEIYRLPDRLLYDLAFYHGIEPQDIWSVIEQLMAKEVIAKLEETKGAKDNLLYVASFATTLRLRTYAHANSQVNTMAILPVIDKERIDSSMQAIFLLPNKNLLYRFYYTAIPMFQAIKTFSSSDQTMNFANEVFFSSDSKTKAIIDMRFLNFISSQENLKLWLRINPLDVDGLFLLGDTYYNLGQYKDAVAQYEAALPRCSVYGILILYRNIASSLCADKQYKNALKYCELCLSTIEEIKVFDDQEKQDFIASVYRTKGIAFDGLGMSAKAIEYYKRSLNFLPKSKFDLPRAAFFQNLAKAYFQMAKYDESIEYSKKCLNVLYKLYGNQPNANIAETLIGYGITLNVMGEYDSSLVQLGRGQTMLKTLSNTGKVTVALLEASMSIASLKRDSGDLVSAIYDCTEILSIADQSFSSNILLRADILNNLGNCYSTMARFGISEKCYLTSLSLIQNEYNDTLMVADTLNNLCVLYTDTGRYKLALDNGLKALKIREAIFENINPLHPVIAESLSNLGNVYYRMTEYRTAQACYGRAYNIYINSGGRNELKVGRLQDNIGAVHVALGNHEVAITCFKEAVEIKKRYKDLEISNSLNNLGVAYKLNCRYQEALEVFQETLKYFGEANHPDTAGCLNNIGQVYISLKNYELALKYIDQGLEMKRIVYSDMHGIHPAIASSYRSKGELYFVQEKFDRALEYYANALEISKEFYRSNLSTDLIDAYLNVGNTLQALEKHKEAIDIYVECRCMIPAFQISRYKIVIEKIDKKLLESSHRLGNKLMLEGRLLEAKNFYKFDPSDHTQHLRLAREAYNNGNLDVCREYYEILITILPYSFAIYTNLGRVYNVLALTLEKKGNKKSVEYYNKAHDSFKKAFEYSRESKTNAGLYTEYANFLLGQNNYKEAFYFLKLAIDSNDSSSKLNYEEVEKETITLLLRQVIDSVETKTIEVMALHYAHYLVILNYHRFIEARVEVLKTKDEYIVSFYHITSSHEGTPLTLDNIYTTCFMAAHILLVLAKTGSSNNEYLVITRKTQTQEGQKPLFIGKIEVVYNNPLLNYRHSAAILSKAYQVGGIELINSLISLDSAMANVIISAIEVRGVDVLFDNEPYEGSESRNTLSIGNEVLVLHQREHSFQESKTLSSSTKQATWFNTYLKSWIYRHEIRQLKQLLRDKGITISWQESLSGNNYRKISPKLHPDTGGSTEGFQFYNDFRQKFNEHDIEPIIQKLQQYTHKIVYQLSITFKTLDTGIDIVRTYYKPTIDNIAHTAISGMYLLSMATGITKVSAVANIFSVSYVYYENGIHDAAKSALTAAVFMVAPYALTFTSIPYVGLAYAVMLNAYTGVNLANNIWFLYQELASKNMILESTEAYQELYQRISDLTGVEWFSEQATEYEISLEVIKQEMQEQLTYLNQEKVEIIAESEDFLGGGEI